MSYREWKERTAEARASALKLVAACEWGCGRAAFAHEVGPTEVASWTLCFGPSAKLRLFRPASKASIYKKSHAPMSLITLYHVDLKTRADDSNSSIPIPSQASQYRVESWLVNPALFT